MKPPNSFLLAALTSLLAHGAARADSMVLEPKSSLSGSLLYASLETSGDGRKTLARKPVGLGVVYAYPMANSIDLQARAAFALSTPFVLAAGFLNYRFRPDSYVRETDVEGSETLRFSLWRPSIGIGFGRITAETNVAVGRINEVIQEDIYSFMGTAGISRAFSERWELSFEAGIATGSNSEVVLNATTFSAGFKFLFY